MFQAMRSQLPHRERDFAAQSLGKSTEHLWSNSGELLVASLCNGRCDPKHPSASGSLDGEAELLGLFAPRMKARVALTQDAGKHPSPNDPAVVCNLLELTMGCQVGVVSRL